MANEEHLRIIRQGANAWNVWRTANHRLKPDLSEANLSTANLFKADFFRTRLSEANLSGADLTLANLSGADLTDANLRRANLTRANLKVADLSRAKLMQAILNEADLRSANLRSANLFRASLNEANLTKTNLRGADLSGTELALADLSEANLTQANLRDANLEVARLIESNLAHASLDRADLTRAVLKRANLSGADLIFANLSNADLRETNLSQVDLSGTQLTEANLSGADLTEAMLGWTVFGNIDLSTLKGLESVIHKGPSTIGIDTLYRSNGHIPEVFLRGAGVPEEFITQIPALVASVNPIQFQSCFISFSHLDEEFAKRLHSAMRSESLRVWFAPEEMKGGKKLHEQIYQAIQVHDRLLIVLSENSMKSEWVMTEIRRAKRVEREENRRKLFPIRLVDFETIQNWECFDADSGKDLAAEVREYYIPDFSYWKDHDSFEKEFAKLLQALRATEK